jgi:hypothetical protein
LLLLPALPAPAPDELAPRPRELTLCEAVGRQVDVCVCASHIWVSLEMAAHQRAQQRHIQFANPPPAGPVKSTSRESETLPRVDARTYLSVRSGQRARPQRRPKKTHQQARVTLFRVASRAASMRRPTTFSCGAQRLRLEGGLRLKGRKMVEAVERGVGRWSKVVRYRRVGRWSEGGGRWLRRGGSRGCAGSAFLWVMTDQAPMIVCLRRSFTPHRPQPKHTKNVPARGRRTTPDASVP